MSEANSICPWYLPLEGGGSFSLSAALLKFRPFSEECPSWWCWCWGSAGSPARVLGSNTTSPPERTIHSGINCTFLKIKSIDTFIRNLLKHLLSLKGLGHKTEFKYFDKNVSVELSLLHFSTRLRWKHMGDIIIIGDVFKLYRQILSKTILKWSQVHSHWCLWTSKPYARAGEKMYSFSAGLK